MKIVLPKRRHGIALFVVMIAIFVLAVLVGAFAFAMKVETKLAMNANRETELLWLGRSGVELARYVLAQQLLISAEPYDSLNQKWAGGPGGLGASNSPLVDVSLENYPIGNSTVTVKITDLERKFNVNMADELILQQAMVLVGAEASQGQAIGAAILDWIDPDDLARINGAESDEYQTMDPPYDAKNSPIDDLSELMLIRGITPEMYFGSGGGGTPPPGTLQVDVRGRPIYPQGFSVGFVDIFTALSSGRVNINTASSTVLQLLPGMDPNAAACIVQHRSGPDGTDGTEDDLPFRNVGELATCLSPQMIPPLQRLCDVRSRTFEVQVTISGTRRVYHAIVGRASPRDIQILSFYWKDE